MKGNAAMGLVMLVVGAYFFAVPSAHISSGIRVLFLVAYIAVAAFYLGKAYTQYRASQ